MNFNCKKLSNKKAFTLIELLIVIAIIGILFIVLVSKVDFATDKAKASGVQTDFRSFQAALELVSKENAGFNTFGWDTGDNAGAAPAGYTYTNADKDKGDRIRNSYDEGDTNLNGTYDDGEVWTGRKVYTENWTGCYTLINPGDASDMSAIFDLETAINKNLDPKLHIVIADDGTISMANGYKDPWSTQYHGRYITNASADAAAKWNVDASMAGSAGDNMDRGAILMYSNGANQKFGTKVKIVGGVVTATVSQIDADHLDNNKMGADDYVLAVVYGYTNGYGETAAITEGFSNNQVFLTGNSGNVSNVENSSGYQMLGSNSTYMVGQPVLPAVYRIDADISQFDHVEIDGSVINATNYNVKSGSTIIEFKASFTETLSKGVHNVLFVFKNGKHVNSTLNIVGTCNHSVPDYGYYYEAIPWYYDVYGEYRHMTQEECSLCHELIAISTEKCVIETTFPNECICSACSNRPHNYSAYSLISTNESECTYNVVCERCSIVKENSNIVVKKHVPGEACDMCFGTPECWHSNREIEYVNLNDYSHTRNIICKNCNLVINSETVYHEYYDDCECGWCFGYHDTLNDYQYNNLRFENVYTDYCAWYGTCKMCNEEVFIANMHTEATNYQYCEYCVSYVYPDVSPDDTNKLHCLAFGHDVDDSIILYHSFCGGAGFYEHCTYYRCNKCGEEWCPGPVYCEFINGVCKDCGHIEGDD